MKNINLFPYLTSEVCDIITPDTIMYGRVVDFLRDGDIESFDVASSTHRYYYMNNVVRVYFDCEDKIMIVSTIKGGNIDFDEFGDYFTIRFDNINRDTLHNLFCYATRCEQSYELLIEAERYKLQIVE